MQLNDQRTSKQHLPAIVCAVAIFVTTAMNSSADDLPLWQQGVSQWDGSGYSLPPASIDPSTEGVSDNIAPSGTPGYTMPVAPQSFSNPTSVAATVDTVAGSTAGDAGQVVNAIGDGSTTQDGVMPTDAELELPSLEPYLEGPIIGADVAPGQITQQIESGASVEPAPLQREVIRWYEYPWRWMREGWTNHAEFGLDGSDGNATTLAIQTGLELKRKTDAYTLAIDLDYRQASNRSVITEDNARLNIDYDRLLGDSNWTLFGKFGIEYDEFKAFDLRLNINSGLGYYWIRSDRTTFITRFGAGASREIGAPIDDWTPEAVFGIEAEHQLNSRNKLKGKLDYFPAWEDFSDYRLVTDLGWEVLLNDSENFSLKLALTDRYDSTPQGALANDVYYSALLLYKF